MLKNRLYFDLYEYRRYPSVFESVSYCGLEEDIHLPFPDIRDTGNPPVTQKINFVPDFMEPSLTPGFKRHKSRHVPGYAIELNGVESLEQYIGEQLKPRLRSTVRNKPKKLEEDCDITYTWYYGAIEKEEYDQIMERIREMLLTRFDELNKTNERMKEWDYLLGVLYPLIGKKQASIFLVKDGDTPIAVSVNYHFGPVFCYFIPAFDVAYSQYSLGHLLISKQLEWAIEHGYKLFDFMMGDLRYKREWCNRTFYMETWVVYDPSRFTSKLKAFILHQKQLLKMYLKSKGVDKVYNKILSKYKKLRGKD